MQFLDIDLDQDAQNLVRIGQSDETVCVANRRQADLDAHALLPQQIHHRRSVRFGEVDGGIVRQSPPAVDGAPCPLRLVFDPGAGGDADERAGAGAPHGCHGLVDGGEAFPAIRPAGMDVQFGGTGGDAGRAIRRHRCSRQGKVRVEIHRAGAVDAGLNDHAAFLDGQAAYYQSSPAGPARCGTIGQDSVRRAV